MSRETDLQAEISRRSAEAIAAWRLAGNPIAREYLAAKVGASLSTVIRWEDPKRSDPRYSEIYAMETVRPGLVSALFSLDTSLSFTVPIKTVSEANQRSHWAAKAKRVKSHREAGKFHTLAGLQRKFGVMFQPRDLLAVSPIEVSLTRVAPGILDDDNLASAFKGFRDGMADALGIDDRDPRVVWKYDQRRGRSYSVEVSVAWQAKVSTPSNESSP